MEEEKAWARGEKHCHCGNRREHYEKLDTDNKIIVNLRGLGHTLRFSAEGKGSQDRILLVLMKAGSMSQKELAERMDIQPGSASEVLSKLENAGLIVRTENGEDRRAVDVALTDEGLGKAREIAGQREARRKDMLSALSEEEKTALLGLLEKLSADWHEKYGRGQGHQHCGERR